MLITINKSSLAVFNRFILVPLDTSDSKLKIMLVLPLPGPQNFYHFFSSTGHATLKYAKLHGPWQFLLFHFSPLDTSDSKIC